jgi:hypothetical protein
MVPGQAGAAFGEREPPSGKPYACCRVISIVACVGAFLNSVAPASERWRFRGITLSPEPFLAGETSRLSIMVQNLSDAHTPSVGP